MARSARTGSKLSAPEQLRALVSPARQEIVDTLEALGSATAAQIAEQLGRPADSLYYHLRALCAAQILRSRQRPIGGQRNETVYRSVARGSRVRLHYPGPAQSGAADLHRLVAGLLKSAQRDFIAAHGGGRASCSGARRELWASRSKGWLNAAERLRVNQLLAELQTLMRCERSPDRRLYSFSFVLAPARSSRKPSGAGLRPATSRSPPGAADAPA